MKKYLKKLAVCALSMLMCTSFTVPSFAEATKVQYVGSISVGFTETKEDAGSIWMAEPYCKSSNCELESVTCSHSYEDWTPGNKVTFTLELASTNGKRFSSSTTQVRVNGKNAEIASKKLSGDHATVKVNYWPSLTLEDPQNLIWEDDGWVAVWDKVEHCKNYEVRIETTDDSGKKKTKTINVTKPKTDISTYATEDEVTFSVRAVPTEAQKKYVYASNWVSMNDPAEPSYTNTSVGSFQGKDGNKTFVTSDGTKASGWQLLNNKWYYFDPADANRMSASKWMYINSNWYYFDADGSIVVGWAKINGYWYYMKEQWDAPDYGAMLKGWVATGPSGPWYYLNTGNAAGFPEGAMLTDTVTPDGYRVDGSGAWRP